MQRAFCRLDERELHRRVLKKKKEEEKLRQDGKLEQMADLIIPLEKVSPHDRCLMCMSVYRISVISFKIVPKLKVSGNRGTSFTYRNIQLDVLLFLVGVGL